MTYFPVNLSGLKVRLNSLFIYIRDHQIIPSPMMYSNNFIITVLLWIINYIQRYMT